jgi:methylthiol:coenzyme M methyltransferase
LKPRDIFMTALGRGKTPRPAVGSATSVVTADLMEEVGVFFPEAHLDADKMACLAEAGHTVLGYDNVMPLFSVVHESAALGCQVEWGAKDLMPAVRSILCPDITQPIEIPADFLQREACSVPLVALARLKTTFGDEVAVVGKVFGPWTLAYHIFGLENFLIASVEQPDAVKSALDVLLEVTIRFGRAQLASGADALTLADHCTRDLCSPETYRDFLAGIHRQLRLSLGCPLLLHICGDTSDRIPYIRGTGIECFHYDSKVSASRARTLAGDRLALMGGTSNLAVVREGTPALIAADVREKLANNIDIIGPECAVPLDSPWQNLRLMTDEVHRQCN